MEFQITEKSHVTMTFIYLFDLKEHMNECLNHTSFLTC